MLNESWRFRWCLRGRCRGRRSCLVWRIKCIVRLWNVKGNICRSLTSQNDWSRSLSRLMVSNAVQSFSFLLITIQRELSPFPSHMGLLVGAGLHFFIPLLGTGAYTASKTRDTGYCIMWCTSCPATEGWPGWVTLCAPLNAEMVQTWLKHIRILTMPNILQLHWSRPTLYRSASLPPFIHDNRLVYICLFHCFILLIVLELFALIVLLSTACYICSLCVCNRIQLIAQINISAQLVIINSTN